MQKLHPTKTYVLASFGSHKVHGGRNGHLNAMQTIAAIVPETSSLKGNNRLSEAIAWTTYRRKRLLKKRGMG